MKTTQLQLLYTKSRINKRIKSLTKEILQSLDGEELILIGLLTGSFIFIADLIREFHKHPISLRVDFLHAASYGSGTVSSGKVTLDRDLSLNIHNKWVLVVDDILDTGRTLNTITKHLLQKKPLKLKTCVLLDKTQRREVSFEADYVGFHVPDRFVVGYGLDFNGLYRQLPYIAVLPE